MRAFSNVHHDPGEAPLTIRGTVRADYAHADGTSDGDRAALVGRGVGLVGALAALGLVAALFGRAAPDLIARHLFVLVVALLVLFCTVARLGATTGRRIADGPWPRAVALGAAAALACLVIGAMSLGVASFLAYGLADHPFGLGQALWDYLGKPFVAVALSGALPTAMIGGIGGATMRALNVSAQKK